MTPKNIRMTVWENPRQVDVNIDPLQFLDQLRKTMVCSYYDGIKDDGTIYTEHYYTGNYVDVGKATPKQLAIHNAVGELITALRMED